MHLKGFRKVRALLNNSEINGSIFELRKGVQYQLSYVLEPYLWGVFFQDC